MKVLSKSRIYVSKKLVDNVKTAYPETKGLTYTGTIDWALRKLLEAQ